MSPNSSNCFACAGRGWPAWVVVWLLLLATVPAPAQSDTTAPVGRFLTDSVEIGRPFQYALSWRHQPGQNVLFPDTARHFRPFTVTRLALFPTRTTGAGSLDSAVYTLLSFEAGPVQTLRVPLQLISPTDTSLLLTAPDSVWLRSRLPVGDGPVRSLSLTAETTLVPLRRQFNYPVLLTALLILATVMTSVYILFGKLLRQRYRAYLLSQRHRRFVRSHHQLIKRLDPNTAADTANTAVVAWKIYLERLERQPFVALTTSEIADRLQDPRLTEALRETDAVIYSGTFSEQLPTALYLLRDIATKAYQRRRAAMRAG